MREMDTESPVIWPAWCYTGDTSSAETESPVQPQLKSRKRRLPDRMNGGSEYHLHNNNNNTTTSNNNNTTSVKNERLSPSTPDTSSRSRSVTPSSASYPGTPPASDHPQPPPLAGRNYSDFMRSLAAKYNNANPNDYFGTSRNGFTPATLDPRFKPNPSFPTLIQTSKEDTAQKKSDFPNILNPFAPNPMFPPLIDMSTTQTLLAMVRTAKEVEIQGLLKSAASGGSKRNQGDVSSPLDLSAAGPPMKRTRAKTPSSGKNSDSESPRPQDNDIAAWSVDDVCNFVSSIDICAEYAQKFREQRIDGSGLPLLTEEHLTSTINMKLGPALKLRSILARKMGTCSVCLHCVHCHSSSSDSGSGPGTSGDSGGPS
ncbi:SAM-motif ubiquitously expressed punctatedly localized protein [Carabus blaptoides fortunei]